MTREKFKAIVQRLEVTAVKRPKWYRASVLFWAGLGYAFFFVTIVLLLLIVIGAAYLAWLHEEPRAMLVVVGLVALGALWPFVRSLFVRFDAPGGLPVTRAMTPELWASVERVREKLDAPPVHHVQFFNDFSAAVVQYPKRGLLGDYENYLLIGMQLMLGMTREQFESIIAHELGHLSKEHGRSMAWVYRVKQTWDRLAVSLDHRRGRGGWLVGHWAKWYLPRFAARSFVLRRKHEYEADRAAANVSGVDVAGDALILTYARESQLRPFWDAIDRRCHTEPQPPSQIFVDLQRMYEAAWDEPKVRRALSTALAMRTGENDTHPSLHDRLATMGWLQRKGIDLEQVRRDPTSLAAQIPLPAPDAANAARELLGRDFDPVSAKLEADWRSFVVEGWTQRHRQLKEGLDKVRAFDERPADAPAADAEALLEQALILEQVQSIDAALARAEEALGVQPEHAGAHYFKGRVLVNEKFDDAGVPHLERAMEADPDAIEPGCQILHHHFASTNRHDRAEHYLKLYDDYQIKLTRAQQERNVLNSTDEFDPHGLPADEIGRIVQSLAAIKPVLRVWIARKRVAYFPQKPAYVMVIELRYPWWLPVGTGTVNKAMKRIGEALVTQRPFNYWVLMRNDQGKALLRRMDRAREHVVYDRQSAKT